MRLWPKGKRCAVMISFDVDAETMWISRDARNLNRPGFLAMGEYAIRVGIPRILRLLEKYGILSSFYVPGWVAERHPEAIASIAKSGHEVAHHGYLHEWLDIDTPVEEERRILEKGVEAIERAMGKRPVGYRAPVGAFSSNTMRLLKEYGFVYESGLMNDELPYFVEIDGKPSRLVEIPWTWVLDDGPYFSWSVQYHSEKAMASPRTVFEIWRAEFDGYWREGGCFVLVLHPQNIGKHSRIQMLERLIQYMRRKGGVWFATGLQVAEHWLKMHSEPLGKT